MLQLGRESVPIETVAERRKYIQVAQSEYDWSKKAETGNEEAKDTQVVTTWQIYQLSSNGREIGCLLRRINIRRRDGASVVGDICTHAS
jgi:hypothetical protein